MGLYTCKIELLQCCQVISLTFDYLPKEESEMLLLGKLKVGNPLLVILGNLGREPSLILADLIGSPGGFFNGFSLDSISVQTSVNRILILLTINISN